MKKFNFNRGDKVLYLPENKVYDFGYISDTGKAVIYEEGECNMQDACAVNITKLEKIKERVVMNRKNFKQNVIVISDCRHCRYCVDNYDGKPCCIGDEKCTELKKKNGTIDIPDSCPTGQKQWSVLKDGKVCKRDEE